jgi:hypothetical protein
MKSELNSNQVHTIAHALRIAAERFKEDAGRCEGMRLGEQFEKQRRESEDLADEIEACTAVVLVG